MAWYAPALLPFHLPLSAATWISGAFELRVENAKPSLFTPTARCPWRRLPARPQAWRFAPRAVRSQDARTVPFLAVGVRAAGGKRLVGLGLPQVSGKGPRPGRAPWRGMPAAVGARRRAPRGRPGAGSSVPLRAPSRWQLLLQFGGRASLSLFSVSAECSVS